MVFSSQVRWACTEIGGSSPGEYYNVYLVAHVGNKEFTREVARHVPESVAQKAAKTALFEAYIHADH